MAEKESFQERSVQEVTIEMHSSATDRRIVDALEC